MLRNRWLMSAATFAPPGEGDGSGDPSDAGDDRIPEPEVDDDETSSDPVEETDETDDQDDDEADDKDGDDKDGDGEGDPPPAAQSRGNRQMGELRRQARERAEENARLTRELAELRGHVTALRQPVQAAETPQQRAERLALLSPEDRTQEIINESLARHSQNTERLQTQLLDQSDKQAYDTRCMVNPLYKKFASKVEAELQGLRQKGQNLPRETIATYLIGQAVLAQQGKKPAGNRQQRRQQEARPVRSGGDVQNSRARQRQSGDMVSDVESRFGDVQI